MPEINTGTDIFAINFVGKPLSSICIRNWRSGNELKGYSTTQIGYSIGDTSQPWNRMGKVKCIAPGVVTVPRNSLNCLHTK